jgi:Copine/C2 domain
MASELFEPCIVINLQCDGLRAWEAAGRSDPFAVVYLDSRLPRLGHLTGAPAPPPEIPGGPRDARWELVGRTETKVGTASPVFAKSLNVPYFFERAQHLAVDVYFRDHLKDEPLTSHRFVGSVDLKVPSLARQHRVEVALVDLRRPDIGCGIITIVGEEVSGCQEVVSFSVTVCDWRPSPLSMLWRAEAPRLTISRESAHRASTAEAPTCADSPKRQGADESSRQRWIIVHGPSESRPSPLDRTEYSFEPMCMRYDRLCISDDQTPLRFELSAGTREEPIGTASGTLQEWRAQGRLPVFRMGSSWSTPAKARKRIGWLLVDKISLSKQPSFLDYIRGYEISLILAIDFTSSNGDPRQPGTLHFCDQFKLNEYELAIKSVGEFLALYDSDQRIPSYGFGAKVPPDYRTSHCFSLTGSEDAVCSKIDGVLDAYRHTLYTVVPSGPTVFAETVRVSMQHVRGLLAERAHVYTILLIVTDGVISDMEETVLEIAKASHLPLSIVIVGVGDADFTEMIRLDSDDVLLHETAERDIVQFVPFQQYGGAPEVLAAKVLEEIPTQVRHP